MGPLRIWIQRAAAAPYTAQVIIGLDQQTPEASSSEAKAALAYILKMDLPCLFDCFQAKIEV